MTGVLAPTPNSAFGGIAASLGDRFALLVNQRDAGGRGETNRPTTDARRTEAAATAARSNLNLHSNRGGSQTGPTSRRSRRAWRRIQRQRHRDRAAANRDADATETETTEAAGRDHVLIHVPTDGVAF